MSSGLFALLAFCGVMIVTGRGELLLRLARAIVATCLRWTVGFAWRRVSALLARLGVDLGLVQVAWLVVTVLLVGQAHREGIPLQAAWKAAAFAWGAWLALHLRVAHRQRTAPKRHAKAMHKTAEAMQEQAKTAPAARSATKARRAARDAAKAAQPLPVPPPPPAAAVAVKERPDPPPAPEPQHWIPADSGLDPVWPRWLGGGLLRRWRKPTD